MNTFFSDSLFFGMTLSLLAYGIGVWLKEKFRLAILNPLLVSIVVVIVFLKIFGITYEVYQSSAKYLSYLLTPVTVCLAIPLYQQLTLLKANFKAVILGILSGVLASLISILIMAVLFGLTHEQYVTLLPKSITTAIGIGVSEELGGVPTITVAVIVITGVLGNVIGELVCKIFKVEEPIAKGLAFGTAAHAIGTSRALELGEIEGAMSSLAIAVAGIMTVAVATIFAGFW